MTDAGLQFEDWGTGTSHAAAWAEECCPKCLGAGLVGIFPFQPVCPVCEGSGVVHG